MESNGEMDINHMVLSSEVLGEQNMGTHLGFRGMAMDGLNFSYLGKGRAEYVRADVSGTEGTTTLW